MSIKRKEINPSFKIKKEKIEAAAKGLIDRAQGIQAIEHNAERIMASTTMLRINVSDLIS